MHICLCIYLHTYKHIISHTTYDVTKHIYTYVRAYIRQHKLYVPTYTHQHTCIPIGTGRQPLCQSGGNRYVQSATVAYRGARCRVSSVARIPNYLQSVYMATLNGMMLIFISLPLQTPYAALVNRGNQKQRKWPHCREK